MKITQEKWDKLETILKDRMQAYQKEEHKALMGCNFMEAGLWTMKVETLDSAITAMEKLEKEE